MLRSHTLRQRSMVFWLPMLTLLSWLLAVLPLSVQLLILSS